MSFVIFIMISICIFFFGLVGIFLNRKNIMIILMSIELLLLSINFNFLISSAFLDDRIGQLFAIFVLTVAACESSIGLGILVVYFRVYGNIAVENIRLLKG